MAPKQREGGSANERDLDDAAYREDQIEQQLAELIHERDRLRAARNRNEEEEADKVYSSSSSSEDIPHVHVHGSRPRPKCDEVDWHLKLKGDIPKFSGNETPAEVVDWLTLVNEIFEQMEVPENKRVGIIVMQLQGKAMAWWHHEKQICLSDGEAPITKWQLMEEKLRKHFLPSNYKRELYQQYQQLSQGTRTVDQYTNEFKELVFRIHIRDSKEMLVTKYLFGLQPYIKEVLEELEIEDLEYAHLRALKVEKARKEKQSIPSPPTPTGSLYPTIDHLPLYPTIDHLPLYTTIDQFSSNPTAPLTIKLGEKMEETRKAAIACYEAASDEVKRTTEILFKSMDVDGDGKICVKVFAEFLRKYNFCNDPHLLFSEFDWDKNGFLDFWEVIVFFYVNDTRNVWSDMQPNGLRLSDLQPQPRQTQVGHQNMELVVYKEPRNKTMHKIREMASRGVGSLKTKCSIM